MNTDKLITPAELATRLELAAEGIRKVPGLMKSSVGYMELPRSTWSGFSRPGREASGWQPTAPSSPSDIAIGAQLYKAFQTNPRETIEYLMTQARQRGVQLEGMGGTVDMQAIKATLAEALKPIVEDRARQQQLQEAYARADAEYEAFIQDPDHPFASIHERELAALITQYPTLSLTEAYIRLENAALKGGLDFSKPLRPQWEAKQNNNGAAANNLASAPVQTGNRPSAPLPNGRSVAGASSVPSPRVLSAGTSSRVIVMESLREHGLA